MPAANLDGQIELVAGAFSSDAENSKMTGEQLFLNPGRAYASHAEMAKCEAALPADERIDFVSIVTPNFLHAPVATTFLKAGFHVVCDKPMTLTFEGGEKPCAKRSARAEKFLRSRIITPAIRWSRRRANSSATASLEKS